MSSRSKPSLLNLASIVLRAFCIRLSRRSSTSKTHTRYIPAVLEKITLESSVFVINSVLTNFRQAEECKESTQDAEGRSHPKRVLVTLDDIVTCISHENWVEVVANEGTNLAKGCGYGIVAASNGSGRSLGGDKTNVVARANCDIVSTVLLGRLSNG